MAKYRVMITDDANAQFEKDENVDIVSDGELISLLGDLVVALDHATLDDPPMLVTVSRIHA